VPVARAERPAKGEQRPVADNRERVERLAPGERPAKGERWGAVEAHNREREA